MMFAALVRSGVVAATFNYPSKCFFKLQKSSTGKWWFVDPNGKPFFSLGIDTITFVGDTTSALRAKYGNQSNWADNVVTRLRSWNFNTLGAWADGMLTARRMPYTRVIGFVGDYGGWLDNDFPDVFDTKWVQWTVERAEAQCEPFRNDPYLLGYYLDNEVSPSPCPHPLLSPRAPHDHVAYCPQTC
jgi:hypothetical protein